MSRPLRRSYGSKRPAKALQRAMLQDILAHREKPLTGEEIASLARSYGLPLAEVEAMVATRARCAR